MRSVGIGAGIIGSLVPATSAIIALKRFRSSTAPPPPAPVTEMQLLEPFCIRDRWRLPARCRRLHARPDLC
jgi:hypothetical protein